MPIRSSSSQDRARAWRRDAPASWAGSSTLSSTVRSSSRLKNWKMIPTWRARNLASALSPRVSIRRPATVTVPSVGRSRPAMRLSRVDLPLPDGPMTATTSPAATLMLTSASAGRPSLWYALVTPSTRITSPWAPWLENTVWSIIRSSWLWKLTTRCHDQVAGHTDPDPRIGGEASTTIDGETRYMGRPGPLAYGGWHGHHPRPAPEDGASLPPRPVVAARLEPGPLPGRRRPGPARRAGRSGCGLPGP